MKDRYEKSWFKAEGGKVEGLPVVSAGDYAKTLSIYIDKDGNSAMIPAGWTVSGVAKENTIWGKDVSLVLYQIPEGKSGDVNWESSEEVESLRRRFDQFVWVPEGLIQETGKNEGFYLSRYNISHSNQKGPRSIKGVKPWTRITQLDAQDVVTTIKICDGVTCYQPYDQEYDLVNEWLVKSGTKTHEEVSIDSSNWGNFADNNDVPKRILVTGSKEKWSANNLYDFAGNVSEWVQQKDHLYDGGYSGIVRGGDFSCMGSIYPVTCRDIFFTTSHVHVGTGFRAAFRIKNKTV